MIRGLKPESDDVPGRLSTFEDLTCLICGAASCQTHGDYSDEPIFYDDESDVTDAERSIEREYVHVRVTMNHKSMLRKHDIRRAKMKDENPQDRSHETPSAPCSKGCYKNNPLAQQKAYSEWTGDNLNTLKEALVSIMNKDRQACTISFVMDLPCWEVYSEIMKYETNSEREMPESPSRRRGVDRPFWYNNVKKALIGNWQESQVHIHEQRFQFNPVSLVVLLTRRWLMT